MRITLAPSLEELMDELTRHGWSAGDLGMDSVWVVYCTKGDQIVNATHKDRSKAWELAVEQARLWGLVNHSRN